MDAPATTLDTEPQELVLQAEDTIQQVIETLDQLHKRHCQSVLLVLAPHGQVLRGEGDFSRLRQLQREATIPVVAGIVLPSGAEGATVTGLSIKYGFPFADTREAALSAWYIAMQRATTSSVPLLDPMRMLKDHGEDRRPRVRLVLLVGCAVLVIVAITTSPFLLFKQDPPALSHSPQRVASVQEKGQAVFVSSPQGINDGMQIAFDALQPPPQGRVYVAWMLTDGKISDRQFRSLGPLRDGRLTYRDGQDHTNLLAQYSRVLITEEDAATAPLGPSDTERFYGEITQGITHVDGYTVLDHVRHLLASDPTLEAPPSPLHGGLAWWFESGTAKIQENASSAINATGDMAFVHRDIVRILDYLDGAFVHNDSKGPLLIDAASAKFGVFLGDDKTLSYFAHIQKHLTGIEESPDVSPGQRALATHIFSEMVTIYGELTTVYQDALVLVKMSTSQLKSALAQSTLNDLKENAFKAYSGDTNPITQQQIAGVNRLHAEMNQLSSIQLVECTPQTCKNRE